MVHEAFGDIKAKPAKQIEGEMLDIVHGTSVNEFEKIICNHFLGRDYYIVDPVRGDVGRTIELHEILSKYPRPEGVHNESLIDKIKNFFKRKDCDPIDEHLKDLYEAILIHEGFSKVYFSSKEYVRDCYNYHQPNCIKIEIDHSIVITAPLVYKDYENSCRLRRIGKSRITDTLWIDSVFIYDNAKVDSLCIKGLIESLNSIRWKNIDD